VTRFQRTALRPVARRARRHTEWGFFNLDFEAAASGTCLAYTLFSAAQLIDFEQPTVIRTYLKILVSSNFQTAAANVHDQLAVGIGVQSAQAVAAGALPCPLTDAGWGGWLLHWVAQTSAQSSNSWFDRELVDSRAMRKVQEGDSVFLSVETPATNVNTLDYSFFGRMLFKE